MPRPSQRVRKVLSGRTVVLLGLFCSLLIGASSAQVARPRICLAGARLLDVRLGRYTDSAGVLIDGDRIAAIYREAADLPEGVERIDLRGATLVPGLADLHATASPTPLADADFFYAMSLAYGVTTLRVVDAPTAWALGQRTRSRRGDVLAPRLWIAGPPLAPVDLGGSDIRRVGDAAGARREVAEEARLGVDFVRTHGQAGADIVRAVAAAARSAGVRASAEPGAVPALELPRLGVALVDRLAHLRGLQAEPIPAKLPPAPEDLEEAADAAWERVGDADIRTFAARMAASHAGIVPLLAANRGALSASALAHDGALGLLPGRWRDELLKAAYPPESPSGRRAAAAAAARGRTVLALSKAGVRVATGVDASSRGYSIPGAGLHRELALLVSAGLTPLDAIRAATTNAAELLGAAAAVGQLKVGFKADLLAVDGDPLQRVEDLQRLRLIVRGGEVLDREELLKQAKRAIRQR